MEAYIRQPAEFAARRAAVAILAVVGLTTLSLALAQPTASDPPPLEIALRINPNTASPAELQLLPRIGPAMAEAIIDYRDSMPAPAFREVNDLQKVHRIGPLTAARLEPYLSFDLFAETSTTEE